jgi:hypothetical protein
VSYCCGIGRTLRRHSWVVRRAVLIPLGAIRAAPVDADNTDERLTLPTWLEMNMATRNDSRGTRRIGRSGGNRPRTHPERPAPGRVSMIRCGSLQAFSAPATLVDIGFRLEIVAAVAAVTVAASKSQPADADAALQRCVCEVLAVQIDRLREFMDKARAAQATRDQPKGAL